MAKEIDTTAEDPYKGLLKEGWYPGKKHSVGKRLLQVGTMGIYNPDDRYASSVNKKIIEGRAKGNTAIETEVKARKALDNISIDLYAEALMRNDTTGTLTHEQAIQQAASWKVAQMKAEEMHNKAAETTDKNAIARASGAAKSAFDTGAAKEASDRDLAQAESAANTNRKIQADSTRDLQAGLARSAATAEQQKNLAGTKGSELSIALSNALSAGGAPGKQARNTIGSLDAELPQIQGAGEENQRIRDWQSSTARSRANTYSANTTAAENAALGSEEASSDPVLMNQAAKQDILKRSQFPVPYGGMVSTAGGPLYGPERIQGNMSPYTTTEDITYDDLGNRTGVVRRRVPGAAGPSTAPPTSNPNAIPAATLDAMQKKFESLKIK